MWKRFGNPSSGVVLATVASGEGYFRKWKECSLPSWLAFAERHDHEIFVLTESLVAEDVHPGWNKFIMFPHLLAEVADDAVIVILDADQIFSPLAPSFVGATEPDKIGVVSELYGQHQKVTSFLRKAHLNHDYPLDSAMLLRPKDFHIFPDYSELAALKFYSAGLVVVPPSRRPSLLEFADAGMLDPVASFDGGGDQMPFIRFLNSQDLHELDQRWQGIWPNILSTYYSFLYEERSELLAAKVLASALLNFHLIHFSTTWPEKDFWKIDFRTAWKTIFPTIGGTTIEEYISKDVTPRLYGQISPPDVFFRPHPE